MPSVLEVKVLKIKTQFQVFLPDCKLHNTTDNLRIRFIQFYFTESPSFNLHTLIIEK